jgi:hypothetical protein
LVATIEVTHDLSGGIEPVQFPEKHSPLKLPKESAKTRKNSRLAERKSKKKSEKSKNDS